MLLLLGDQLIRDAGLAVFELVKNAYDADSTECTVTMFNIADLKNARIVVRDDGTGMDIETITSVWLEPGTEFRADQRAEGRRSKHHRRLPLGEKGVGRFAAHKLGRTITLVTRKAGRPEVVVQINWDQFESSKYLSEVVVNVVERQPIVFTGAKHGTKIEITRLRDEDWTRGKVRDLHRAITSICSPFNSPEDFKAHLVLDPPSEWIKGLIDIPSVLKLSLFRATGRINGNELFYDYRFVPLSKMDENIKGRKRDDITTKLMSVYPEKKPLDLTSYEGIGEIKFDFHIFDREPSVLELSTGDKSGLKKFLDQNGGVRIYRDGMRVFDFGEPGNDWLDLGGRRVNVPTRRISNNVIIGAVSLDSASSRGLIEKTNREGFIENDAYEAFRQAVLFAITQIEAERAVDKIRLRQQYSRQTKKEPVVEELGELRVQLDKKGLSAELGGYLDRIERQFVDVRDRLLTAAGPGLTLTVVVHEVEKIIKELVLAVKQGADKAKLTTLVEHLAQMVDGLSFFARKSGNAKEKAAILIRQALFNTEFRLKAHGIKVTNGFELGNPDFSAKCARRLIIATLMNLIDNAIYWLDNKGAASRQIYLGTTMELDDKPAIIIADNGPGFIDPPEYLVEPFFSRKPDGMGLGLHIANEVMKIHKGHLLFPETGDLSLPKQFSGAIVALQFPEAK
jgi:signal transduction histidine kinase